MENMGTNTITCPYCKGSGEEAGWTYAPGSMMQEIEVEGPCYSCGGSGKVEVDESFDPDDPCRNCPPEGGECGYCPYYKRS
jgi:DnaJ-class molecular chaperone